MLWHACNCCLKFVGKNVEHHASGAVVDEFGHQRRVHTSCVGTPGTWSRAVGPSPELVVSALADALVLAPRPSCPDCTRWTEKIRWSDKIKELQGFPQTFRGRLEEAKATWLG